MNPQTRAVRALNRFGLGARAGEASTLGDPKGWLLDQLEDPPPSVVGDVPDEDEVWVRIGAFRERQRARDREGAQEAGRRMRELYRREARLLLDTRVTTERPFVERLVAFWSNHLCISVGATAVVAPLAGLYERQAVRPHVLGRFEEMVLASVRHPAMLVYLDNFRSIGPDSAAARLVRQNRNRELGLNENYARELLELHTLGLDGGYGQGDVEELARLLTGWTVPSLLPWRRAQLERMGRDGSGARGPGSQRGPGRGDGDESEPGFAFLSVLHDPGEKAVLAGRYGEGQAEGERAIRDLCRHPATADFVAGKLARHFLSEEPAARDVEALASVFRATGGDLSAVAARLVELETAWDPDTRLFRTPQDWLVAVLRAVHHDEAPDRATGVLRQLRHTVWAPDAPRGYPDGARSWADPDSLMNRAELARSLAGQAPRDDLRPERLLSVLELSGDDPLPALVHDETIGARERLALVLGGPAFQWR